MEAFVLKVDSQQVRYCKAREVRITVGKSGYPTDMVDAVDERTNL